MNQKNEGITTAIFAGAAAVAFILAWWFQPAAVSTEKDLIGDIVGKPVFPSFENPADSSSFQIVKFDEVMAQLERFEVAKDSASGLWRLPSYDDYPADAAEQVRDATTPLVGLTVLGIPSFDRGDHALYGVVNPDDEDLSVSESGVGMLVRVRDAKDTVLASLIIGKEVDQADGQRYVRVPTEDAVYQVELDTTPFTTDFKKWIKGQLLDVRGFDISNIGLRDYALFRTQTGASMQRNFDADVSYDADSSKWSLDRLVTYDGPNAAETELTEDETLNDTALNDLRNAIQDLEIVGVFRKPKGLAADLKADQSLMDNNESLQSLYERGFYPQERPDGIEIFATGGETIVGTKDGVKYLLRFGESAAKLVEEDGEEDSGLRRYLLVTTSLDQSHFPQPELQVSPETVEEMLAMEKAEEAASDAPVTPPADEGTEAATPDEGGPPTPTEPATTKEGNPDEPGSEQANKADSPATEPTADDPKPVDEPKQDAPKEDTPKEDTPSEEPAPQEPKEDTPKQDSPAADVPKEDAPKQDDPTAEEAGQPVADDGSKSDEDELNQCEPQDAAQETAAEAPVAIQSDETKTEEAGTEADTKPAPTNQETEEELQERLERLQEEIARDNQRKLDERKEKMDEARKKVLELNARFADWYYVVSDSVYKKLTLSRDTLIKNKSEVEADPGVPGAPSGLPPGLPPGFQFPNQ